jgi:hypothetical protein
MTNPSATPPPPGAVASIFEPITDAGSACAIRLPVFEGPLDLLLHLIRQNELGMRSPISQVANQYLRFSTCCAS